MLAASNIVKFHGPQRVLSEVTVVVPPGARIGLVGPNGVGKSTLLRILAGLEPPDAGTVRRTGPIAYLPQVTQCYEGSGGEAAWAALAEVLDPSFDTLLLDEPTNDLDLDGSTGSSASCSASPAGSSSSRTTGHSSTGP